MKGRSIIARARHHVKLKCKIPHPDPKESVRPTYSMQVWKPSKANEMQLKNCQFLSKTIASIQNNKRNQIIFLTIRNNINLSNNILSIQILLKTLAIHRNWERNNYIYSTYMN